MAKTQRRAASPRDMSDASLQAEVCSALSGEHRIWARKRLNAVLAICDGSTQLEAARQVGVSRGTVERWLRILRKGGRSALLAKRPAARSTPPMSGEAIAETRREIASALRRRPHWRLRKRLEAVEMVLAGGTLTEAAAKAHVLPKSVKTWMSTIRRQGIVAFLRKSELLSYAPRLDVDSATLRELAARERNPRVRKRMLAVAHVAEGMGYYDAGVAAHLQHGSVKRWVERVKARGIAVFHASS